VRKTLAALDTAPSLNTYYANHEYKNKANAFYIRVTSVRSTVTNLCSDAASVHTWSRQISGARGSIGSLYADWSYADAVVWDTGVRDRCTGDDLP
jgi:hypothetical protein